MGAAEQRFERLAGTSAARLRALEPRLRQAVLGQLEHGGSRRVAQELGRLLQAPWWAALDVDDRIRAARVVTHVSACADGSPLEPTALRRRTILDNTLLSLLPPHGRFGLVLEDLPLEADALVAGSCRAPDTVVLNRRAISCDDRPLGQGRGGAIEHRVALCTLVHEVNHLHNFTPPGPTYESFQDEYRAWYVGFVAQVDRLPRRVEALERCRELLTNPCYAALGRAVQQRTAHGERIVAFMQALGPQRIDDYVSDAPLPQPPSNMSNAPISPSSAGGSAVPHEA